MPFEISPVLPADIPLLPAIQWAALLSNPLIQTLYPEGATPALIAFTQDSYRKALQYPSVKLIKAADVASGETVAFAKWIVYSEEKEELIQIDEEEWVSGKAPKDRGWGNGEAPQRPEGINERALGAWNAAITKTRRRVMSNRTHTCRAVDGCSLECYFASIAPALWVLDIIHTHPSCQGQGAGTQLLKWGTDLADKTRVQCYVESSAAGQSIFQKNGFEDLTEMKIDLSKYQGGQGSIKYKHSVMMRSPDVPPLVPPKDLQVLRKSEWDFGFLDSSSSNNSNVVRKISRKASLIEIKRSPRPNRSTSSKRSDSFTSMTGRFPDPPTENVTHAEDPATALG